MLPGPVMVVEDDHKFRQDLSTWLQRSGIDVIAVPTGWEAVDRVMFHQPALILLDINLVDMSGIDVYRELQKDPRASRVPIIAMSGLPLTLASAAIKEMPRVQTWWKADGYRDLMGKVRDVFGLPPSTELQFETSGCSQKDRPTVLINSFTREILIEGRPPLILPRLRFELFCALWEANGPVQFSKLLRDAGRFSSDSKSLVMMISRLRQVLRAKLQADIVCEGSAYELVFHSVDASRSRVAS